MFNIAVLKLKDIIKHIIIVILIFIICMYIKNQFNKTDKKIKLAIFPKSSLTKIFDQTLPQLSEQNYKYTNKIQSKDILKTMLKTQISSADEIDKIEENKSNETNVAVTSSTNESNNKNVDNKESSNDNSENKENTNDLKTVQDGIETNVITKNPITDKSNAQYGSVKIKNETDYELTNEVLTPDITADNKNIVIFHTHSCESYTSSEKYQYQPTGNYRTTDLNYTVVRVGTELEENLKNYGFNVIHSKDYHDYPSYNGSYTRSLKTVKKILESTKSDVIIDLHRDAVGSRSDYAPTVKIGDEEAAQIMFVIGTDNGGLWHPNWKQNLKFAIKVQEKANEMYPGLFKTMMLTKSRYNQHTGKYANIIEVGATGNTLDQCLASMKYLAKVFNEVYTK